MGTNQATRQRRYMRCDMYFEIWQNAQNKNWYWHLKAANNQIIAHGEGYQNKADCLHAISLVKQSYSAAIRE